MDIGYERFIIIELSLSWQIKFVEWIKGFTKVKQDQRVISFI